MCSCIMSVAPTVCLMWCGENLSGLTSFVSLFSFHSFLGLMLLYLAWTSTIIDFEVMKAAPLS